MEHVNTDFAMATQTSHTDTPFTEIDFDPPTLTPNEIKKKDEMNTVDVNEEQEKDFVMATQKGYSDTPLTEMDFVSLNLTPNEMKKDKMDAVDVTTEQDKDFAMATQAGHTEAHLTKMDFDSPNLTPSEMTKKDKMDAVDVSAEQAEAAEADVQKKVTDLLAAGDERRDARLSFQPEVKLDDIFIEHLFVKHLDGKKSAFHDKKAREDCHLGGGSFGEVFKAVHTIHGEVAVKVAKPGKEDRVVMYQKEAGKHVLALTSHRIVAIRGFVQCDDDSCQCGLIGIVMEYMECGSLWDFRINNEWEHHPDPWPLTGRMVYHISLGMHFLHSKNIVHRDLKLENVLIDAQLNAKIADLGLATNLRTSSGDKSWGTNSHKPPEAFRTDLPSSTKIVTPKYDVYSFAMTLYELLTGIHPYSERAFDMMRLLKVDAKQPPCLQPVPPDTPEDLQQIMIESWSYEPADRPNFGDITEWVDKLDTKPTHESLGYYLGKSRSSKKGGKAASPVSEPELPVNTNGATMREGIGNLTEQDQAPAKGHCKTNTSVPVAETVIDHESLRRKMEHLNVNVNAPPVPSNGNTMVPVTETVKQHPVEGQQSLPTHLGQDMVGTQPVRHHSEPNPGQCEVSSPQVSPRPHDSSLGSSPNPATGAVSQGTPGNLSQFGSAVHGSKKDDVQPVTERPVPQEPTQEPRFRSLKSKPENDDSLQAPIGAGQSMDFKGLESAPTTDPPGPSANKPLRSYMEHDKYQGPDPKYGYAPNASVGTKQEVYSHNFHSQPKAEHLNPYPYGHNKPANGRPVPVDSPHGTTEYAIGPLSAGPIHQESPAAMPSPPSSTERDPIIIFDSAQLTDEDFEIELHVDVTIPVRSSITFKLEQIISSHERCKHRAYWQNSNSLHATLISHEFTLRTLHLPPTLDEDRFMLLLRVSNKAALEKLHSFSKKGLLPEMLYPIFVDRHLVDLCSPVKPDLKVEPWEDQFNRGMAHFKKKEKAKSRSKKTKKFKPGAPFTHEKEEATLTKSSSSGTTQFDKGNIHINMTGAPKNMVFGNQYFNHTHYHGVGGARGGDGFHSFPNQMKEKPKKPKLCGSKQKVSGTLLLEISDVIFEKDVKSLGRHLGLREVEVDNLVYSHRGERSSEIAYQVLNEWLQRNGQRATKAVLAEALWKAKCYDAAESVQ